MRRLESISTFLGLGLLAAAALFIWHFAQLPLQPAHVAMARVSAISAHESRLFINRDHIYLRNQRGFGQFTLNYSEDRCHVGDQVKVLQRGSALSPLPRTCR